MRTDGCVCVLTDVYAYVYVYVYLQTGKRSGHKKYIPNHISCKQQRHFEVKC